MITETLFLEIMNLKEAGLTQNQTAKRLNIDNKTVGKYWELSSEEFIKLEHDKQDSLKNGKEYSNEILEILQTYPEMSAMQIYKTICRNKGTAELGVCSTAFRGLVAEIRKENHIPKPKNRESR